MTKSKERKIHYPMKGMKSRCICNEIVILPQFKTEDYKKVTCENCKNEAVK